jgi:phosphatidate cytidylyltransferase
VFWKRALTAVILIPATVALVLLGPIWLVAGIAGVVILLALWEFFRMGDLAGFSGYVQWTTLCALLVVFSQWRQAADAAGELPGQMSIFAWHGIPGGVETVLILFLVGLGFSASFGRLPVSKRLGALLVSAGGMLFVALPLSYLVRMVGLPEGRRYLLLLLVMMWVGDTSAYLVGKAIGHMPMAPVLSPKKTWEGSAANLLGSVVVALVAAHWLNASLVTLVALAVVANLAGQVGDLLESSYKRSAGVKDSGQLLPGHGGMLDRIDSLTLAAPVAWWYLWMLTLTGHLR